MCKWLVREKGFWIQGLMPNVQCWTVPALGFVAVFSESSVMVEGFAPKQSNVVFSLRVRRCKEIGFMS